MKSSSPPGSGFGPVASRALHRQHPRARRRVLAALVVLLGAACDGDAGMATRALFDLESAGADLFAIPYPSDARTLPDGTIDLAGYEEGRPELLQRYLTALMRNKVGGYSTSGASYFRFSDALATDCLPAAPEETLGEGAGVQLVDIDPDSPGRGQRVPVTTYFDSDTHPELGLNSLAVMPMPGFVLQPSTTYSVILTSDLCDRAGRPVQADAGFRSMLAEDPPQQGSELARRAHAAYAPLRDYLRDGDARGVINASVFTTGQPAELAGKAREVLYRDPAPVAKDLLLRVDAAYHMEIQGTYEAPNFQQGTPPFWPGNSGGQIDRDADGFPVPARTETMRFALTVPKGEPPPGGWPVVIYAHGTGGDYRTFISKKVAHKLVQVKDDAGEIIAKLAVVGIDQVHHGARNTNDAPADLTFFNLDNPDAWVGNTIQGGIDNFSLLRMLVSLSISELPWAPETGLTGSKTFDQPIELDPQRVYFMGHSQGGLTGSVFLAHEPEVKGAVLSGAGGGVIFSLLGKTVPFNIAALIKAALNGRVDEYHPLLTLMQQLFEAADPNNYGRMLLRNRPTGMLPKHLFMSQGFIDHYTPNATTESLATAVGLPHAGPILRRINGLDIQALAPQDLPLSGNLQIDGHDITAALLQYDSVASSRSCLKDSDCYQGHYCRDGQCNRDGHFVVFHREDAARQYTRFLATLARDGIPTIAR